MKRIYLNDVSSLISPPVSSSSEPALLTALLAMRDDALEFDLEVAGDDCFDNALRDTVLLLSKARLRRSCMMMTAPRLVEGKSQMNEFRREMSLFEQLSEWISMSKFEGR